WLEPDFNDERSLYIALLQAGGYTSDPDYLEKMTADALKQAIRELFDLTSMMVVIDDIDTLTTKGLETGSDFLYRTLAKAKSTSKILYTVRNLPTASIANSIEVPGLQNEEFSEFVDECVSQYGVPAPSREM